MVSCAQGQDLSRYLQNAKGKTMASVYSIRSLPGGPVSAPLSWDELHTDLDPRKFTLRTMRRRLERKGDLWQNIFKQRCDMQKVLSTMKDLETWIEKAVALSQEADRFIPLPGGYRLGFDGMLNPDTSCP